MRLMRRALIWLTLAAASALPAHWAAAQFKNEGMGVLSPPAHIPPPTPAPSYNPPLPLPLPPAPPPPPAQSTDRTDPPPRSPAAQPTK
jgi:hypothetical protein